MFKNCAEKAKVDSKGLVVLDVPTRWNSTYLMLESALKFRGAFEDLVEDDRNYGAYFVSDRRVGPPVEYDWEVASSFAAYLKPFYEITLRVCCSSTPTIQSALLDVYKVLNLLRREQKSVLLGGIASSMQAKFDKYWGKVERMNQYYFIALVLDPRHKLGAVEDCFGGLFEDDDVKVAEAMSSLKLLLTSLHKLYEEGESGKSTSEDTAGGSYFAVSSEAMGLNLNLDRDLIEKRMKRKAMKSAIICNDLDRYLLDPIEYIKDLKFDLLGWWKLIGMSKYPIVSQIARDVLAIPASTIASESCFSTSGRVINSYRSSLSPEVVVALICTQNWLLSRHVALHSEPSVEEVESYHSIAQEMANSRAKLPPQPSNS